MCKVAKKILLKNAFRGFQKAFNRWLRYQDSNLDRQNQNLYVLGV